MAVLISAYFTKAKIAEMVAAADEKGLPVTIAVNDDLNNYNQNVSIYKAQTKEQREAKDKRAYFGNGSVVWTDNKVTVAPKKGEAAPATENVADDLPF